MIKIPRCMSTQHPDNVHPPFFAENSQLSGEDEIQEAYYAFSHLGCDEQMWDCEGKEIDNYVVKKLLSRYPSFFQKKPLGKEVFLTLRVPNPAIEKAEAKILLETLESLPRSYDAAATFSNQPIAPIFEVILPMTTSAKYLNRLYYFYQDFVVGKENQPFQKDDATIAQWIGEFFPKKINIIPLFEDQDSMLGSHLITQTFLQDKKIPYQRVFLARSDPAMNYGLVSAVLFNKIALSRLHNLSKKINCPLYPIIGVGSAPFRGNLTPQTVNQVCQEYPSAHTFTIQSAFKYDFPPDQVESAIQKLKKRKTAPPLIFSEKKALSICQKYTAAYQKQIQKLSPIINQIAKFIPHRRQRKLHIGLFGYSRNVQGVSLPRAITFTASLYSLGLPPEFLGLNALSPQDFRFLKKTYLNFENDLLAASQFLNLKTPFLPKELKPVLKKLPLAQIHSEHQAITAEILLHFQKKETENLKTLILQAAERRNFLG